MERPSTKPHPTEEEIPNSQHEGEIPVLRWSNRRKMAWKAFYLLLGYTAVYWFFLPMWFQWWGIPIGWLEIIGESFSWFASTMAAVIVSYMGFTTLPFLGKGRKSRNDQYDVYDEDY